MVFIDLTGSTTVYEALGNAQVAPVITQVTQWIGRVIAAHDGQVIKFLGDGVLALFQHSQNAVEAAVFLQQNHTNRLRHWPEQLRMGLKIGMASGPVVSVGEDIFGDAVNLASRLSDMAGPNAIWAAESVIIDLKHQLPEAQANSSSVRYRSLGLVRIRGLAQPHSVFQVEWNEDVSTDLMTVRGELSAIENTAQDTPHGAIVLAWLGTNQAFSAIDLPIIIGRMPDCGFIVDDQRVSRHHARLEWTNGTFSITDTSSFGTWVRFADNQAADIPLRRTHCILHSTGEIALGAPFSDFSAPTVAFQIHA